VKSAALLLLVLTGCKKVAPGTDFVSAHAPECDRMTYYAVQIARERRPLYLRPILKAACDQLHAKSSRRAIADSLGNGGGRDVPRCSLFQSADVHAANDGSVVEVSFLLHDDVATVHELEEALGGSFDMLRHSVRDGCPESVARFTLPQCVIDAKPKGKHCQAQSIEDEPVEVIAVSLRSD
jgi:hypothetical protein